MNEPITPQIEDALELPKLERLEFDTLGLGDVVRVTTGTEAEVYRYGFLVQKLGHWPLGNFDEIRPDGTQVGPMKAFLHGCGQWTDRNQNPVQRQERAFTGYWEGLIKGLFMVIQLAEATPGDRLVFDKRGQNITEITVQKPA